jgi:hypothetical protein
MNPSDRERRSSRERSGERRVELNPEALLRERPVDDLSRLRGRSVVFGVVGLALMGAGWLTQGRAEFLQSYLIAFIFWMGITMGSLALLMVQYLSGGAWGMVARRIFEAATRNLPLMFGLFLPIALNLPVLYEWMRPEAATDPIIRVKAAYLNAGFFFVRAAIFFVIWGALAFFFNRWSKEQDDSAPRLPGPKDGRFRALSGPGLVLYMLTLTFMSVDWILSLAPHFYSTIFGILMLGGQGLSTMAFTILTLAALARFKPLSEIVEPDHFHDLGKLMLAFVMLWAYFNVSQLIIIYSGNLPDEVPWYLERMQGTWAPVAWTVFLGHFVLPFGLLLSRDLKRRPTLLSKLALFVLFMRVVDLIWTIGPVFRHAGSTIHWLDFAAVIGMGGVWLALFFTTLGNRSLVPAHDPYFKEAMAHGGH